MQVAAASSSGYEESFHLIIPSHLQISSLSILNYLQSHKAVPSHLKLSLLRQKHRHLRPPLCPPTKALIFIMLLTSCVCITLSNQAPGSKQFLGASNRGRKPVRPSPSVVREFIVYSNEVIG